MTVERCAYDDKAEHVPDYPLFRHPCRQCAIRALASGPQFQKSGIEGSLAAGYRRGLALIFGDGFRDGHSLVRAEYERNHRLKTLL